MATLQCPVTNVGSTGAPIDQAGGKVSFFAAGDSPPVELTIPPGALSKPTFIRIIRTECPPPFAYNDWSPVYQLDPPDLVFAKVAKLSVPWEGKMPGGAGEVLVPRDDLAIYLSNGNQFERVKDDYVNAGFNQATISHLGSMFVGIANTSDQSDCH